VVDELHSLRREIHEVPEQTAAARVEHLQVVVEVATAVAAGTRFLAHPDSPVAVWARGVPVGAPTDARFRTRSPTQVIIGRRTVRLEVSPAIFRGDL
jgi:hypothetical protein